jgi:hypothetical protein
MTPSAKPELSCAKQAGPLPSSSLSFGMTLVMATACGVAAANIYYSQPMLGIMEAAFPGQVTVIGLVPTTTQLGFAAGLLLLVPLTSLPITRTSRSVPSVINSVTPIAVQAG